VLSLSYVNLYGKTKGENPGLVGSFDAEQGRKDSRAGNSKVACLLNSWKIEQHLTEAVLFANLDTYYLK